MTYEDAIEAGRARIAAIIAHVDPADVAVAAREAAGIVRRYQRWSVTPLLPHGNVTVDLGQGVASRLVSAGLAATLNVAYERRATASERMAIELDRLAVDSAETDRMLGDMVPTTVARLAAGTPVEMVDMPLPIVERIMTAALAMEGARDAKADARTLATLFDALNEAQLHDHGMRVLHACEALGKETVRSFFSTISESSRGWMGWMITKDAPLAA
jgi:hypothetical protein